MSPGDDRQQELDLIFVRSIPWLGVLLFVAALSGVFPANAETGRKLDIVLDPGHTPMQPGALGVRGIYEVAYNDHFVAKLAKALRAASFTVNLTRLPDQSLSLIDRAAIANDGKAGLFLSIHHDSAQPQYLKKVDLEHGNGYQTMRPIAGYSIFVSRKNPRFASSYRLAERLGQALLEIGRFPTLHHAEDVPGERRELLSEQMGIYRFDDLVVLARTTMPAVLLEVGVIVNPDDERYLSSERNQDDVCRAIVKAIEAYAEEPALIDTAEAPRKPLPPE